METNKIIFSIIAIALVGSIGGYIISHRVSPSEYIEGHALLPQYTKGEMIRQSDAIVIGTVIGTTSSRQPSVLGRDSDDIVTEVKLNVESYLRNYTKISAPEITVQTLGGTIGSTRMEMDGAAKFTQGERVLVFLSQKDDKVFTVYGWSQGKYTVGKDDIIGLNEDEISSFTSIFGTERTLAAIKGEIAKLSALPPKKDVIQTDTSAERTNAGDQNSEANKILGR